MKRMPPCLDCGKPSVGLGRCVECQQKVEARNADARRYPPQELGVELEPADDFARPMRCA
jgi:hypothetical protein